MRYNLSELCDIIGGGTPKTNIPQYWGGNIPWLSVKDFNNDRKYVYEAEKAITEEGLNNSAATTLIKGDIIISARGTVGEMAVIPYPMSFNQSCYGLRAKKEIVDADYLYYLVKFKVKELKHNAHGSVFDTITRDTFEGIEVDIPSKVNQQKIASILAALDSKIETNETINHNLQQQVLAMYQKIFVDSPNDDRRICRADECFDISIGKTPPRKEAEWFKTVQADNIVWVSIADMGNCGLFIADSSEYLSPAAVKKFNVAIVPDNTVLLSFKLTVGRIAITDVWMTTNEAIAHFKTENKFINEYLYCYLKSYNFQTLGSTSSIATAVNSKIIKAMPFVVPTDDELAIFHNFAAPIFEKIKAYQHENVQLTRLRDSLLPKLMSGEIDVSDVVI